MIKTLLFTTFSITIMLLSCGNPTSENDPDSVIDADGNVYTTVKIGNQVWTVENLRVTKYNDGTPIPNVTDAGEWEACTTGTAAYCYYNNDSASYAEKYGALYNWHTVNTGKLAPAGWHVPTDAEWDTLLNYLIANGYNWDGTTTDNKVAKSMATKTGWGSSIEAGDIGNDMSTNNTSNFSALPTGSRFNEGNFMFIGSGNGWWSASEGGATTAWDRMLGYGKATLDKNNFPKVCGFSVRLVKD